MASPTDSDHSGAVLFSFFDGKLHGLMRYYLADVMMAFNDCRDFAIGHDLGFFVQVYRASFDK
jgi:hypothetical protein